MSRLSFVILHKTHHGLVMHDGMVKHHYHVFHVIFLQTFAAVRYYLN